MSKVGFQIPSNQMVVFNTDSKFSIFQMPFEIGTMSGFQMVLYVLDTTTYNLTFKMSGFQKFPVFGSELYFSPTKKFSFFS